MYEHPVKLLRAYAFLARNYVGAKIVNAILDLVAFMDFRMLFLLSIWHPDNDTRIKYLRKRGVNVGEHCFIDQGVWIELTAPQGVVIEDYVAVQCGARVVAHDAAIARMCDAPMRVKETRLKYGSGVGMNCIVMPGVTFEKYGHALAGSVVTKDVPEGMVVMGQPAEVMCSCIDIGKGWQHDVYQNPQYYYDVPNAFRPTDNPFDEFSTWREDGVKVNDMFEMRTGTVFDVIFDYKLWKKRRKEGEGA